MTGEVTREEMLIALRRHITRIENVWLPNGRKFESDTVAQDEAELAAMAGALRELEAGGWPPGTFSPDQVLALDQYQRGEGKWAPPKFRKHPFTCPNRGDGNHRANSVDLGALVPTVCGWICPYCSYPQAWAHDHMKVSPPTTSDGGGENDR